MSWTNLMSILIYIRATRSVGGASATLKLKNTPAFSASGGACVVMHSQSPPLHSKEQYLLLLTTESTVLGTEKVLKYLLNE